MSNEIKTVLNGIDWLWVSDQANDMESWYELSELDKDSSNIDQVEKVAKTYNYRFYELADSHPTEWLIVKK